MSWKTKTTLAIAVGVPLGILAAPNDAAAELPESSFGYGDAWGGEFDVSTGPVTPLADSPGDGNSGFKVTQLDYVLDAQVASPHSATLSWPARELASPYIAASGATDLGWEFAPSLELSFGTSEVPQRELGVPALEVMARTSGIEGQTTFGSNKSAEIELEIFDADVTVNHWDDVDVGESSCKVVVPDCGAYFGAYVSAKQRTGSHAAENRLKALEMVEADLDRSFDIDHQFYRWDDLLGDRAVENHVRPSIEDGRIQFISWKPVTKDGVNVSWTAIAEGEHDERVRDAAARVADLDVPVMVVFDHEANSRVGEFDSTIATEKHVTTKAGQEQDFVDAWQHVHDVFEDEGAQNVSWVWVMTRKPFEGDAKQADALYPGDAYVDWVGVDPYNFNHDGDWKSLPEQMEGFTDWATTRKIDKPWILAEFGSVEDPERPGRKAEWMLELPDYVEGEQRLKALVHFDSKPKPHLDWRYDSSGSARNAFIDIANEDIFLQQCSVGGTSVSPPAHNAACSTR